MKIFEVTGRGSTLAVRTIDRYADEIGRDSMDYDMFKKSAELLDKEMLKSLAQHIENSDTAPREYVMKVIAKKDPETFKKMYGDQDGYFSLMKPQKELTDDMSKGMNKYGLSAVNKDGKFYSYKDDKLTGTFDNIEDLRKHQQDLIKDESLEEGADFYGYYKDPKDPEGKTFTYPKDMEFKTPHRSNASARMLLSRIGLDPDFENTGSTPIDDFLDATDKYLRMNVSDKDNPYYDEVEVYDQEAKRFKKQHPEITHVGFN
tara:strand:+ start:311 stop:1090 length:780 start_codon:yes stop_codon:yes gene_type:complete